MRARGLCTEQATFVAENMTARAALKTFRLAGLHPPVIEAFY